MNLVITKNNESGLYEIHEVGGIYDGFLHNSFQSKVRAEKWVAIRLKREAEKPDYCQECLVEDLFTATTNCKRHAEVKA